LNEQGFASTAEVATIVLSIGSIIDYPSLCKKVSNWPGMKKDDHEKAILLPLPYSDEHWPVHGTSKPLILQIK
jgi:hypothetical protein